MSGSPNFVLLSSSSKFSCVPNDALGLGIFYVSICKIDNVYILTKIGEKKNFISSFHIW